MNDIERKALRRQFEERKVVAGIYCVRNTTTGRCLIGAAVDVTSMLARQRAQLKFGSSPDRDLQAEWDALGAEAFAFETLDALAPRDGPVGNQDDDLRVLKSLWLEKLTGEGVPLYARTYR